MSMGNIIEMAWPERDGVVPMIAKGSSFLIHGIEAALFKLPTTSTVVPTGSNQRSPNVQLIFRSLMYMYHIAHKTRPNRLQLNF